MPDSSPPVPLSLFDGRCCTVCSQWKCWPEMAPINSYRCRDCKRRLDREYYARNAEKVKATVRAYAQANPEKIRARNHSPEQKARQTEYERRPESKAHRAAYRQTPTGKASQKRGQKKYNQTPKGVAKNRLQQHRRRVAGTLAPSEWLAICAAYEHTCAYCGEAKPLQIDHVTPITRGGVTTRDNIVPACERCNKCKQANEWTPRPPARPPEFD